MMMGNVERDNRRGYAEEVRRLLKEEVSRLLLLFLHYSLQERSVQV